MAKVIVKINPKDGTYTVDVNGIQGTKCENITDALIRGNEEVERQYNEEWHTPDVLPDYITNPEDGEK